MKKPIFLTLFSFFLLSLTSFGQNTEFYSTRLDNAALQLKRYTVDLVDRTAEDLRRSSFNSRNAIEEAFLAHQIDAAAGLFQQMVRDNRRASELRDAAAILTDLARRAPGFGSNNFLWRNVQNAVNDINRELGGNSSSGGGSNNDSVIGRVFWRGTIDDRVHLVVKGGNIETRTISGRSYTDGIFNFTSPLPSRQVSVDVTKTRGRGTVRVIQQPSRLNDFTAIIEIYDPQGGAREYLLEIFWK
jgi:hypothetical protein